MPATEVIVGGVPLAATSTVKLCVSVPAAFVAWSVTSTRPGASGVHDTRPVVASIVKPVAVTARTE